MASGTPAWRGKSIADIAPGPGVARPCILMIDVAWRWTYPFLTPRLTLHWIVGIADPQARHLGVAEPLVQARIRLRLFWTTVNKSFPLYED